MRLLNTHTGKLAWFNDGNVPAYAILSHRWGDDEQTFKEVDKLSRKIRTRVRSLLHSLPQGLSAKLRRACEFAAALGYEWIWVDTCCIDKASSAELSEAINSMFAFYSNADACIAYLADVPDDLPSPTEEGSDFWKSEWFSRGWTLQELIAPRKVLFVSQGWKPFGTKADLAPTLEAITGVNKEVLTLARSLSTISIAERMSWAAERVTTRVEDRAYSLLGIFGVYMSTLYGEGTHAFRRLQEELLRSSPDQTLFAWEFPTGSEDRPLGLFAESPSRFTKKGLEGIAALTIEEIPTAAKAFRSALGLSPAVSKDGSNSTPSVHPGEAISLPCDTPACSLTNFGVRARIPVLWRPAGQGQSRYAIAILAAAHKSGYVGLVLQRLLQGETTHYAAGMHGTRLIHVGAHPSTGDRSSCRWAEELDLAHDDVIIQWEDIYITTMEPWNAQIRPAVAEMPLGMLSGIPVSDLNYFRSGHHHSFVARRCLSLMNGSLRQDLCGIGDPTLRNEDVPDLASRIAKNIPEELRHACKLWLTHLPLSSPDPKLLQELSTFASEHLLHWIETLGFLGELRVALVGLPKTFDWLPTHAPAEEALLRNADRVIRAHNVVLNNFTLQLYHHVPTFGLPDCELSRKLLEVSPPKIKLLSPRRGWTAVLGVMQSQQGRINSVAFMRDNVRVVSGSEDGSVSVWDHLALERVATLTGGHHEAVYAVACSPDGKLVASCGSPAGVALWDARTRSLVRVLEGQRLPQRSVAFSADSSCIAAGSDDGTVRVWSVGAGETITTEYTETARAIAFSRTDRTVLALGCNDGTIKLWDLTIGDAMRQTRGHLREVTSVAFSPDGSKIVSGGENGKIRIWDVGTGGGVLTVHGHKDRVTFAEFTSDGSYILSSSRDGTIRKWDATTGLCLSTFTSSQGIMSSSLSPDGSRIASASGETIQIWDAYAPSQSTETTGHEDAVSAVDFAPDGKTFGTSSFDKTVRLWKTSTAELLHTILHDFCVQAIRFSPDGTVLATASDDLTIRLFETACWQEVGPLAWPPPLDPGRGCSLAFSADGSRLACGAQDSVAAWDVKSRERIAVFRVGHGVDVLAFSPDMTQIATGFASEDSWTHHWDVATGRHVAAGRHMPGSCRRLHSLEFSSDGAHVVARQYDGIVSVGAIRPPTAHDPSSAGVCRAPLRFAWQPDSGWLHLTAGPGRPSRPVCWFPRERRPHSYRTCYAWHGDVVVVGSPTGIVTVVDLSEVIRSL